MTPNFADAATLSYPKEKIRILLLENLHPAAVAEFARAGYADVEVHAKSLPAAELAARLREAHVVGIRSKTQLTAPLLAEARRLLAVGTFSIGTDQVDLAAATELGIPVFNSPFSSTRSVAELVIGASIALLRGLVDKSVATHQGAWPKSAVGARELRGKTLGIVGYGRIGSQVSVLAEALNMHVVYHDVLPRLSMGTARALGSLREVLQAADIVTLHVPDDASTRNLVGAAELQQMRPGAFLINYARGRVVDVDALAAAIRSGHLAGAAVDVFPEEPRGEGEAFRSPLQGLPGVILTPHVGGSTEEAQENIGLDVARKLIGYLDQGVTTGSVTVPELMLPSQTGCHRLLHIHRNAPGVLSELNAHLAAFNVNIEGQYLKTNERIGYVVLDIAGGGAADTARALDAIRTVRHTIRARSLY